MGMLTRYNRNNNTGVDLFDNFFPRAIFGDFWNQPVLADDVDRHLPAVRENDEDYRISLAAPGLDKKDFTIQVEGNRLTLGYDASDNNDRHAYATKYTKSYTLPSNIDGEKIEATYKSGVLTVSVPKTEAAKARTIKVK